MINKNKNAIYRGNSKKPVGNVAGCRGIFVFLFFVLPFFFLGAGGGLGVGGGCEIIKSN